MFFSNMCFGFLEQHTINPTWSVALAKLVDDARKLSRTKNFQKSLHYLQYTEDFILSCLSWFSADLNGLVEAKWFS